MNRRKLFEKLGEWATALGFGALLPARGEARRLPVSNGEARHLPVPSQAVHWVSLDRHHIEGRIVRMTKNGIAAIEVTVRPPVKFESGGIATTTMLIEGVPEAQYSPKGTPMANTWHHPEPAGSARPAKPYAEWWYRKKPTDGHGELTAKPSLWHIKKEGAEAPLIPAGLIAYRIDDADYNREQSLKALPLVVDDAQVDATYQRLKSELAEARKAWR